MQYSGIFFAVKAIWPAKKAGPWLKNSIDISSHSCNKVQFYNNKQQQQQNILKQTSNNLSAKKKKLCSPLNFNKNIFSISAQRKCCIVEQKNIKNSCSNKQNIKIRINFSVFEKKRTTNARKSRLHLQLVCCKVLQKFSSV